MYPHQLMHVRIAGYYVAVISFLPLGLFFFLSSFGWVNCRRLSNFFDTYHLLQRYF